MSINALGQNSGNIVFNSGAVSAGTNAGTIQTTATVNYSVNGIFRSKAATNNIALPAPSPAGAYTAGAIQSLAVGEKALFALYLDAAGNFSFAQSAKVAAGEPAPAIAQPSDKATVAVFTVTATSNPFVPGTTGLGAAGINTVFYNTSVMPGTSLA